MIDRRLIVIPLTVIILSACTRQETENFCDDHYLVHESHLDSIGSLKLTHSSDGTVRSEFSVPISIMDAQTIDQLNEILGDPDQVLLLQTETACRMSNSNVTSNTDSIVASYEMDCGAGTRIEQVDVLLFDAVEDLHEIETQITTPATQKRFAINRQCSSAIFRLRARSDP